MSRRRAFAVAPIALALIGAVLPMSSAQASVGRATPTASTSHRVVVNRAPMTVMGFDKVRAAKAGNSVTTEAGYQVLRDRRGRELARVPVRAKTGAPQPFNVVYGNCGSSFFYLYDLSGAQFAMRTGFSVNHDAYDFEWHTLTTGQNSYQTDRWEWEDFGPQWPSPSWSSGYVTSTQDADSGTYYYGRVTYGVAYLVNGSICWSGYPSAGKYLYK